jgi:3-phenylpropionate/cinnamic acid dioxygenase small subunit
VSAPRAAAAPLDTADGPELLAEVTAFLYREARLADESRYEEWLALWTDDAQYWIPSGTADYDRDRRISFVNDNRNRLVTRVRQLQTGVRYAQTPPSPMRRVLSNIELLAVPAHGPVEVGANFVLYELAVQATNDLRVWAGRATYRLRRHAEGWQMASKTVELVNASQPLPNLAFLL